MKNSTFLLCILTTVLLPIATCAAVIHVPADQPTIQAGIDAAVDGDTILVADGTYTGDGNRDIDFKGKAITVASENGAEKCTIDCQGTEEENHRGFYFNTNENEFSIVRGFSIHKAYIDWGGGIYCKSASPTICNCVFAGNTVLGAGGGIFAYFDSNPRISDSIFNGNKTEGIYCISDSNAVISNCTFSGNISTYYNSGAITCIYSSPTIYNCDLTENESEGIYCYQFSFPIIFGCSCIKNSENGIRCEYCSAPTISNCIFTENSKKGIYCNLESSPTIYNCAFINNLNGGIWCFDESSPTIHNCFFYKNADIGIRCEFASPTIYNCILWDQTPIMTYYSSDSPTVRYSNIKGGFQGIGNINTDPCFIGGDPFDYHLSPDSPCIDAGTDLNASETDLDGNLRLQGGAVDIGAYEYQGRPQLNRSYVKMPSHSFVPGNTASCSVSVWNAGNSALIGSSLFTILDVIGNYYCAPSFTNYDYFKWSFPAGLTELTIIPDFTWPNNVGSASDIVWYAFLMNPELTRLESEIGVFDFGWSE